MWLEVLCTLPGRDESEKIRQLEQKIQSLTKNLQDLQSSLNTMNEHFQMEAGKPGFSGGGTSSGGRNPADAAQPEIKETIHSIQTKLDQLDNRTQVSPVIPQRGPGSYQPTTWTRKCL